MNKPPQQPFGIVFDQSYPSLSDWLRRSSLQDIMSDAGHSEDFNGSRSEYIYLRIRLIGLAFAALALLWMPIDFIFLAPERFLEIFALRLAFSGGFLLLGIWTARPHSLTAARLRLAAFVLIPSLFYFSSRVVLDGGMDEDGVLVGYTFLPYLTVSLLAVFPLTLLEGLAYAAIIGLFYIGTEAWFGTLFAIPTLGHVWLLGLLAGIAIWAQLAQLHMLLRLYREASHDALTGLANRRTLSRWLDQQIDDARKAGTSLSVLLFDLDLFKRINDTYGHLSGDAVLQGFSRVLQGEVNGDEHLIGRYGGEEFLAVLPGLTIDQASATAERIRLACHRARVKSMEGEVIDFTVSIGVAELAPGENAEALLSRVDEGLYQAKESGRDFVARAE